MGGDPAQGDSHGGKHSGNNLGLLLRHMAESLLRRFTDAETTAAAFAPLKKYDDVREGMLLVLDGLVKPKLPNRAEAPVLWKKFRAARRELIAAARTADN